MLNGEKQVTLNEGIEEISLGEIRIAERYFGHTFGEEGERAMTAMETMTMAIWSRQRRTDPTSAYQLVDAETLSMRAAKDYWIEEPADVDDDEPETDGGKDGLLDGGSPESAPSSPTI